MDSRYQKMDGGNVPCSRVDIMTTVGNLSLPDEFIRLYRLALYGLNITRAQMYNQANGQDIAISFTELFGVLSTYMPVDSNLQRAVSFTCSVLTRFHSKHHSTLQQHATEVIDFKTAYPKVHMRLCIAESLYSLRTSERVALVRRIASEHVGLDSVSSIAEFVQAVCDRPECIVDINPNPKWRGDIPDEIKDRQPRRRPKGRNVCLVLSPLFAVITLSILAVLAFWLSTFINRPQDDPPITVSVNGSMQLIPILLKPEGFQGNGAIRLTTSSTTPITLYRTTCDQLMMSSDILEPKSFPPLGPTLSTDEQPFNIHPRHPINLAPGSKYIYEISASYSTRPPTSPCLQIFLFDSYSEQSKFEDGDTSAVHVANSSCLGVGPSNDPNESVVTFDITSQASYYTQIRFPKGITFNVTASAIQVYYNVSHIENSRSTCDSFSSDNPCVINTCDTLCYSPFEGVCLLVTSATDGSVTYQTYVSSYLGYRAVTIFFGGAFAFILIVFIGLAFIYCWYYCWLCCWYDMCQHELPLV